MIEVRKAEDRGKSKFDWLDSCHTFSFANYHDSDHMGFSSLRVLNDDRVIPGGGFPTHSHKNMEIISYVVEGAMEHKDSIGNSSIIRRGDIQRMSAGTGVTHSEFNASNKHTLHFLQIWIVPDVIGIDPGYEQKKIPQIEQEGHLRLLASPEKRDDSVLIHQDALLYVALLGRGQRIDYAITPGRKIYIHVVKGAMQVNGIILNENDGARIFDEKLITLEASEEIEVLLFDLP